MSQYTTGTVTVTNGSPTVTGSGTTWSGNVSAGACFTINNSNAIYFVGSVDSNTQITLTSNYAGANASAQSYTVFQDFTTTYNLPLLYANDQQSAAVFTRAMQLIDETMATTVTGVNNLTDLNDTNIATPTNGQVLKYDTGTSKWVNGAVSISANNIDDLGDVVITGVADNEVLAWDNGTSKWINQTAAEAGLASSSDLSTHAADTTLHLTGAQNTWIDAITATSAEVNYLSGVTSDVQTQLNNKQPLDADLTAIAALTGTSGFLTTNGAGSWAVDATTYSTFNPTITTPSSGQGLMYNGSIWVNSSNISNITVAETRSANINMADYTLQRPAIKDYGITHTAPSYAASLTFDCTNGNSFKVTLTGNVTSITLSNPPASGTYGEIVIMFVQDGTGSRTVTGWPASVKWVGGTAFTTTTLSSSIDKVVLSTVDGGSTWLGEFGKGYL